MANSVKSIDISFINSFALYILDCQILRACVREKATLAQFLNKVAFAWASPEPLDFLGNTCLSVQNWLTQ